MTTRKPRIRREGEAPRGNGDDDSMVDTWHRTDTDDGCAYSCLRQFRCSTDPNDKEQKMNCKEVFRVFRQCPGMPMEEVDPNSIDPDKLSGLGIGLDGSKRFVAPQPDADDVETEPRIPSFMNEDDKDEELDSFADPFTLIGRQFQEMERLMQGMFRNWMDGAGSVGRIPRPSGPGMNDREDPTRRESSLPSWIPHWLDGWIHRRPLPSVKERENSEETRRVFSRNDKDMKSV